MFTATLMLAGCGGDDDDPIPSGKSNNNKNVVKAGVPAEVTPLEFPRLREIGNNIVVVHKTSDSYSDGVNYSVEWDIEKKSQRWTCYQMMRGYRVTGVKPYDGNPLYPFDEDLPRYDYFSQDLFWGSGFDHGHICPKASRLYSDRANYQTFYLTNMQPQYHVFNAGIWVKLENRIRSAWTPSNSTDVLYVCKGGTIDNENQIIKRISGKLIVPKYFFTALLLKNSSGYRAVGFWFEHTADDHSEDNLKDYAISIDALEQLTGIDFFCNLPDDIEAEVEASYSPKAWGLN
jgi:endonuclease G